MIRVPTHISTDIAAELEARCLEHHRSRLAFIVSETLKHEFEKKKKEKRAPISLQSQKKALS
jgi:hypothetical protein